MSALLPSRPRGGVPRTVGRFELRRELGKGAQATVWLGYDARLDREVAVKLLKPGADATAVSQWLHEARSVSRLNHPHIVPVYEADEQQGQSYLVFEYVAGPTLAEKLKRDGALAPREAVMLMLGVVEALQTAHAAGIVHRDLKPSNILVDGSGRARVMDFGIAARVKDGSDQRIVGTPGYMSPEAARGEAPSPSMDIFAAGMMFGELLAGKPLLRERDPYRAIHRVQQEDMTLPAEMSAQVDDALRAIVLRAIARDPAQRFAGASDLHAALTKWLTPDEAPSAASGNGTLDFLLRRMRHKSDFPALSDSVGRIQRVANSDNESLNSLSAEILKDVALTNKLLRLVNSAHYSAAGGAVSTVSRAIALVGFAGIRNMALSLVLLEHMQDKTHAQQLKEEFLRSLMAGTLASELCTQPRDSEEAFIGSLFHGLGRLLTEFYFPEEARQIRQLVRPSGSTPPLGEKIASGKVLGLSYEDLGLGVARHWGLPDTLQRCMSRPEGEPPAKPVDRGPDRQRWLAAVANEVADTLLYCDPKEAAKRVNGIAQRHARALEVDAEALSAAADVARTKLSQMAAAMGLHVAPQSPARRLLHNPVDEAATQAFRPDDSLTPHQLQATAPMPLDDGDPDTLRHAKAADMLAAGIQDITNTMVSDNFKLNEVLRMILETMYRGLRFRRVVFCLRDPKTETLTGRFGLGEGSDVVARLFKIPLRAAGGGAADLFSAIVMRAADTLIADATAANIAQRLPGWYRGEVYAPSFLLLPLTMKSAPFALIYADMARAGGIVLDEKELSLLRTLRNQAVMAFRQAGS
jgi:serine/threonine protein kinase